MVNALGDLYNALGDVWLAIRVALSIVIISSGLLIAWVAYLVGIYLSDVIGRRDASE